ncbi:hypothetical protein Tco_0788182 [Tanacetum coccineum]
MNSPTFVDVLSNVFRCLAWISVQGYGYFCRFDFVKLFKGERGDVHCSGYLIIPTAIPATVPIVDSPVVHDETPFIPTETPAIPHVVSTLPHTSPFLYIDSADSDTSERPPSHDPYEVTVSRWRSKVAARSSPPSPPTLHQILPAPPGLPRRTTILVLPGQPIPVGRPYRTQPNGVRKMLTTRNSVGPLPSHRLALRYSESHSHLDHFYPDDFSSDTSLGSASGYSSDTSSGRSIPDSSFDSPAASFTGPSCKRRRSPVVFVPLATPVLGALSPDDSAEESYEAYTEPDVDSDVQADIDADNAAAEAAAAREADARVEVDTRIDREGEEDEEAESSHRGTVKIGVDTVVEPVVLKDTLVPTDDEDSREVVQLGLDEIVQELHDHLEEIHIWRIRVIESVHRDQGHKMLVASQQSVVMSDRIRVLERDNMRLRAMLCIKRESRLIAYDITWRTRKRSRDKCVDFATMTAWSSGG